MSKKVVAIAQSNYIPWRGYFDMINMVDCFVILDDVQYTKRDWRNRNLIKTPKGTKWLSIPVKVKGKFLQLIQDTEISQKDWAESHWGNIKENYNKAPCFDIYESELKKLYEQASVMTMLSEVNFHFLRAVLDWLDIPTAIRRSTEFSKRDDKILRLLDICKQLNADIYLSGPAAKSYMDESVFLDAGIVVQWMDYSDYKEYHQLYPPFDGNVSIFDLIFNEGGRARSFLKSC